MPEELQCRGVPHFYETALGALSSAHHEGAPRLAGGLGPKPEATRARAVVPEFTEKPRLQACWATLPTRCQQGAPAPLQAGFLES